MAGPEPIPPTPGRVRDAVPPALARVDTSRPARAIARLVRRRLSRCVLARSHLDLESGLNILQALPGGSRCATNVETTTQVLVEA